MIASLQQLAVFLSSCIELSLLWKATLLVTLGLFAVRTAWRARAATRHLLLSATLGALLVLPAALPLLPRVTVAVPAATPRVELRANGTAVATNVETPAARAARRATLPPDPMFDRSSLLRLVWLAGIVVLLVPMGRSVVELRRLARRALPWAEGAARLRSLASDAAMRRRVDVLVSEALPTPVTYGFVRPVILLPMDAMHWSAADLDRALIHELEHVRRGDWLLHLLARTACAIYWFHPLVWTAWRRLGVEAERACDDAVLQRSEGPAYAEQLVALARRLRPDARQPLLAMAGRSDLSTRVHAILDLTQRRGRRTTRAALLIVTAATAFLAAIAPLRAAVVAVTASERVEQPSRAAAQDGAPARLPQQLKSWAEALNEGPYDRALLDAAGDGDSARVASLIRRGADVNAAIAGDGSPLIAAARQGQIVIVEQLIDAGADVSRVVPGDGNALIMAAASGHLDVVEVLLNRGADINTVVPDDENALMQASANGHLRMVQLLVDRGADVHTRVWAARSGPGLRGEWRTALSQAQRGGHATVVEYLRAVGAR